MDHFIFEGGGRQLSKKIPAQLKVEKKKTCTVGQGKKWSKPFYSPNEKIICNFCHNLISTHKNAL